MSSVYFIRNLDERDAAAWASLRKEALASHPLAFSASIPANPNRLAEDFVERLEPREEGAVFGAFTGATLVGAVGIRRIAGAKERHKAFIWGMYVAAQSRRDGAGDKLLRAAIEHSRGWPEVTQLHLAVSDVASDARRLYERNGFQEWGREPRALCWNGRFTDETHMVLDLLKRS